eukprot:4123380-Lingulodinium_polyedra.AAC.1
MAPLPPPPRCGAPGAAPPPLEIGRCCVPASVVRRVWLFDVRAPCCARASWFVRRAWLGGAFMLFVPGQVGLREGHG